jgi:tRNA (cmo5U34)-methyltransferase
MSGKERKYMHFPNYDEEIRSILPYYDSFHQETINLIKAMNAAPAIWLDTRLRDRHVCREGIETFS